MKKTGIFLFILALILGVIYVKFIPMIKVVSGYTAKCQCSNHFETQRTPQDISNIDLKFLPIKASANIDEERKLVRASVYGLVKQVAQYKDDLGCVLVQGEDDYKMHYTKSDTPEDEGYYPYGNNTIKNTEVQGINYAKLNQVVNSAFDADGGYTDEKTRAVVVIYKDTLIAEKYGQGHDASTPIIGWSMTKSIMNTLIGMLVKEGKLSLDDNHLFPEWENDGRREITIRDLLHMNSGLDWDEIYDKYSDATEMLYVTEDVVKHSIANPLKYKPGEHWYYSSGTSNILSGIIRNQFSSAKEYYDFLHKELFGKIGMHSAFIETDEAGNFIGSSFGYATARDWGKYGTLYLHDGVWNDERILPEGWVDFSRLAAPNSKGEYGAHFWLNVDHQYYPDVPDDMYSANGFQGQKTIIIPSKDMVIVRLGFNSEFDFNNFIKEILASID